jgi:hypothetical protein
MMSADVEGSFAGFFPAVVPFEGARGGGEVALAALPLGAASACAVFFLRAIVPVHASRSGELWGLALS